jgi:hypothetical protein
VKFFLGTHRVSQPWWDLNVPLFVSRRILTDRKTLPHAHPRHPGWALDSGGFTELSMFGEWRTSEDDYVQDVRRFAAEVGRLDWVAPMDWMCEPFMLAKTGLTVDGHQVRTVANFRRLRERLGTLVIPVLQGWTLDEYLSCWDLYHQCGVDLEWEPVIGLGSVCRRQNTAEAGLIVRALAERLLGRQLHGFGVKLTGLESFGDELLSADSMAWSFAARRDHPMKGHTHKSCANCIDYAVRWRDQIIDRLGQQRLEVAA